MDSGGKSRKSGRVRRVPEKAGQMLQDEEVFGSPEPPPFDREEDSSEEFNATAADENEADESSSDAQAGVDEDAASSASGQHDSEISDVVPDEASPARPVTAMQQFIRQPKRRPFADPEIPNKHSQGVYFKRAHNKEQINTFAWLTANDPVINQLFLQMRTASLPALALPFRRFASDKSAGMGLTLFQSDASRAQDAGEAWRWFTEGLGQAWLQHLQKCESISAQALQEMLAEDKTQDLVSGQPSTLRLLSMAQDETMDTETLFQQMPLAGINGRPLPRRGWLMNFGTTVQYLAWAPNCTGLEQYLLVCPAPRGFERWSKSSAFAPSPATLSCLQLYRFVGVEMADPGHATTIDTNHTPRKALTLCSEWGRIKQAKWCPVPQNDAVKQSIPNRNHIGFLALVTGDGKVRVLNITLPSSASEECEELKLTDCAFVTKPPNTICTCVAWVSATLIAAGCANGYIAIWDLESHFSMPSPPSNPVPEFYHQCHHTYITELATSYPSYPHFLISTSMDGYTRVTDMRDPVSNAASAQRTRNPLIGLGWMDHCLSFLTCDDMTSVKAAHVRYVEHFSRVLRAGASITCLALSPAHTCILVGCADGTVTVTNAMRSLYGGRDDQLYQQVWFKHEWRRPRQVIDTSTTIPPQQQNGVASPQATPAAPTSHQNDDPPQTSDPSNPSKTRLDFPTGLTRLTSGYRLQNFKETGGLIKKRNVNSGLKDDRGTLTTLYERESAVYHAAWNPNLRAAGWAAAAVGTGLVLVEDLCVD
ncbi:MAG: hypothetical protein Q9162_007754 [Coniocarpon cinnabarinum]